MLTRLLVRSYSVVVEISLWVLFGAGLLGGFILPLSLGVGGIHALLLAIIVLAAVFMFAVLLVAPLLLIKDIRHSVRAIEIAVANGASPQDGVQRKYGPQQKSGHETPPEDGPNRKPGHGLDVGDVIKTYKGKAIIKEADGVSVEGVRYPGLLTAEKAISGSAK
ncbi:MAG: hypothetical protein OXH76_23050 [Boseongicola sp.]|nr:hypothetical protein [Boseongicola sp.]